MDPATASLASAVVTALVPIVSKGAEEIAKAVSKDAYEKGKNLIVALKKRWVGDKAAERALVGFEDYPDTFRTALEDVLKKRLADDSKLASELTKILDEMVPALTVIQKMKEADGVVGIDAKEIKSGTVKVGQETETAKNMTGVKAERIG